MAESYGEASAGTGLKWHSWTRSISGSTVHSGFVHLDEYPYASYTVSAVAISTGTVNDHLLEIRAGSSLPVRIRHIRIEQVANATAVAANAFILFRISSAGTGGTSLTPAPLDTADSASGATAMTRPSSKGTETTEIRRETIVMRQAIASTATQPEEAIDWDFDRLRMKPLIIAAGTTNGICIKNGVAVAGATANIYVEFVETSFV